MKILILGFTKLKYMPYMNFYLDNINSKTNEIHLVYWDRDKKEDITVPDGITPHKFEYYQEDDKPKFQKINSFVRYRQFVKKILSESQFDFVVSLHTLPAVLMYRELIKKFGGKYILDYRDYTYEKISVYQKIITKLVEYSAYTFISSDAFRKYMPPLEKVKTTHNILLDSLDNRNIRTESKDVIRIRYWGLIRYSKTQIEIIRHIANDPRFEFHFNGREQAECEAIKKYVKENNIHNVFFHGEYRPEDRFSFIKDTDIIQNIQDFDSITENAVSNKFYDAALFYIPQICSDKSFMGKCAIEYGLGFSCSAYDENFADCLYKGYKNLNKAKFKEDCDAFTDKIVREYRANIDILNSLF